MIQYDELSQSKKRVKSLKKPEENSEYNILFRNIKK